MASKAILGKLAAAALLAALVFAAFGGALECGFVLFDDNLYVTENTNVQGGLTTEGLRWAFTTGRSANWHPLTWLSHMADVELYGLEPAGHHATSLLFHALNASLLFFALRRLTGRSGLSWLAAALWAVHPLRTESVVWISERKDVLAMFFALLALGAYGRAGKRGRMGGVALCFALSLMSKPMAVTLPFLLLLVDFWPLRRWPETSAGKLVREKWALFLLAAGSGVVTYFVQQGGGAVRGLQQYPLEVRLGNAALATGQYLADGCWPVRLMVFYPHPGLEIPAGAVGGSVALLALLTAAAWAAARRQPWWTTGWLWFAGALVPMIGLVQVGGAARADRYTYLPHIGLVVALVWGAAEILDRQVGTPRRGVRQIRSADASARRPYLAAIPGLPAAGLVAVLVLLSRQQTRVWRDSETLFRHALEIREDSSLAHGNLGIHYVVEKREAEAERHLLRSLEILEGNGATHGVLGALQAKQGRVAEGETLLLKSLELQPRWNEANGNLANVYFQQGRTALAIRHYRIAVEDDSKDGESLNNLAWLLAAEPGASRAQAEEALAHARRAVALAGDNPGAAPLDTLALAQAATGDFSGAVATAEQALAQAEKEGNAALKQEILTRRQAYQAGKRPNL